MGDSSAFWDKIARRYAARPVGNPEAYDHTLDRTRAYLNAGDRVLELGCGTGTTALRLADTGARITATDYAANMIAIAREKPDAPDNVAFVQARLGDPALGSAPCDAVLAFNLVHLFPDPAHALGQINALLKPGGLFISKTVCLADGWTGLLRLPVWVARALGKAPYVTFLSVRALESMIRKAGFEIVETGSFPAKPPSRFVVARKS